MFISKTTACARKEFKKVRKNFLSGVQLGFETESYRETSESDMPQNLQAKFHRYVNSIDNSLTS